MSLNVINKYNILILMFFYFKFAVLRIFYVFSTSLKKRKIFFRDILVTCITFVLQFCYSSLLLSVTQYIVLTARFSGHLSEGERNRLYCPTRRF